MRKYPVAIISALLMCMFIKCPMVVMAEPIPESPVFAALTPDNHELWNAYTCLVKDFALYKTFLQDGSPYGVFLLPAHAGSRQQAVDYLSSGFSEELAGAIVEEYTRWDETQQKLLIVPCEGIPVLTGEDASEVSCAYIEDKPVFKRIYRDCYAPGDEWAYVVTLEPGDEDTWKISTLSLTMNKNGKI